MTKEFFVAISVLTAAGATAAEGPAHRKLAAVPFTDVKLSDRFWAPRLETNRRKSLPHNFQWCEQTGRIDNFSKAGGLMEGKFRGIYFNDSDVYKVLEGASYSLAADPDPALERTADSVIAKIAAAQQPDGYLNTYFTLAEAGKRWSDIQRKHELYCAGHLIEAAVAHYRATGKRTLLNVAVKYADYIASVFGPGRRLAVPGHEELELALVKLYQVTGQPKYLALAKFFIDLRGDRSKGELWGVYQQDHLPVRRQSEIVGHAVRATYLYSGTADVAAYTGDRELIAAMDRLWQDVTRRKMYVTGGIGARAEGEAFGAAYELPNDTAYCETCAAIGLALWAHRLNLMHADAQYADVLERVLYNGILAGVGMDGRHFFYVNPLASDGKHHRQPFFGCACCPSNVVRFVPSLPGYVYATADDGVYVNLYVASSAKLALPDNVVTIEQETDYPWDGRVKLTLRPRKDDTFAVFLRIPGWCQGVSVAINGNPALPPDGLDKGYVRLRRKWKPGDTIDLNLPMPVERMEASPRVQANLGRAAIQRGPIVYCFEAVDNGGHVNDIVLARDPDFAWKHRRDLLGGVTVVTGTAADGRKITAVPYYAWDHRAPGEMIVWARQDGEPASPEAGRFAWGDDLYRPISRTPLPNNAGFGESASP